MYCQKTFYYTVGIVFLALAKAKNMLWGYSTPKTFDVTAMDRCVEYDLRVVDAWLNHLEKYTSCPPVMDGKHVLELGPGSDLGIGLYLLFKGCETYHACDVNNLVKLAPDGFYLRLFEKLCNMGSRAEVGALQKQWEAAKAGKPSRLHHSVMPDFDIASAVEEGSIDVVFSQAAFEHFEDIDATFSQLNAVCKPGAVLVAEIDLKTHSRWIRDVDPNNIYRYSNWLYKLFGFRGVPNRWRPYQYKEALERHGWGDVSITPLVVLDDHWSLNVGLSGCFVDPKNQMKYLSVVLCARRRG